MMNQNSPENQVKELLNQYIVELKNKSLPYKPKPAFTPSTLSSPCLRKIYYSYLRVEKDNPVLPESGRIFETGDALHGMVQKWLRAKGLIIDYKNKDGSMPKSRFVPGEYDFEFPAKNDELELKGKLDGVGFLGDKLWIYEIKSIKGEAFDSPYLPFKKHRLQAMTYPFLFETSLKAGKYAHIPELRGATKVEGIIFIYLNKNTSDMKYFSVRKNLILYKQSLKKREIIKKAILNGILPKKTADYCDNCPYLNKCKTNSKIGANML